MDSYKTSGSNSIGGSAGASLTPMSPGSVSKPQSELEREFNMLGAAADYLSSRISILENKLSPIMLPEAPTPSNEKAMEPATAIGKAIRGNKSVIDTQIYRLESILNRLSI